MEKKVLVIIYHGDDWEENIPLKTSPETRLSFEEFYLFAQKKGIEIFRASIQWYNAEKECFEKGWQFSDQKWTKVTKKISPSVVFDKVSGKFDYSLFELKQQMSRHCRIVNSPLFRTQFDNKLSQYIAFREYMPASYIAENDGELSECLQKISTTKVVMKEVYGSGGKQVVIGEKETLQKGTLVFPLLIQEFVETAGIPDFSQKGAVADLRLVYIENELIYALSRIARSGSLHTNFHQGATALLVPLEKIPEDCRRMAEDIRKKLSLFSRTNYSLDFMFDTEGRPMFIEMNTTPGFDLLRIVGTPKIKEDYYEKLLTSFFEKIS